MKKSSLNLDFPYNFPQTEFGAVLLENLNSTKKILNYTISEIFTGKNYYIINISLPNQIFCGEYNLLVLSKNTNKSLGIMPNLKIIPGFFLFFTLN